MLISIENEFKQLPPNRVQAVFLVPLPGFRHSFIYQKADVCYGVANRGLLWVSSLEYGDW